MTEVYKTILAQLGGRRFLVMTGSKNLVHSNNGYTLQMHLTRNKAQAKFLEITLEPTDLYTVKFTKLVKTQLVTVAEYTGVYNDMLPIIFTKVTGLNTSL